VIVDASVSRNARLITPQQCNRSNVNSIPALAPRGARSCLAQKITRPQSPTPKIDPQKAFTHQFLKSFELRDQGHPFFTFTSMTRGVFKGESLPRHI
jgi:hypothetical protein